MFRSKFALQLALLTFFSIMALPMFFSEAGRTFGVSTNTGNVIGLIVGRILETFILIKPKTPEQMRDYISFYRDVCLMVLCGSLIALFIRTILIHCLL